VIAEEYFMTDRLETIDTLRGKVDELWEIYAGEEHLGADLLAEVRELLASARMPADARRSLQALLLAATHQGGS
jgi:hypothetical protein